MTRLVLLGFMIFGVAAGFFQIPVAITMAFALGLVCGAFCFAWIIIHQ